MKNNKKGISLIVLVITIIVIIILAAAVILTLNNNNPIDEANNARYSSDVANMQAILTNTVAKIMAANQSTITITPVSFEDDDATTTDIKYQLDYPMDISRDDGVIHFQDGTNSTTATDVWVTGKALPQYNAGDEYWSVNAEGNLGLKAASGETYGSFVDFSNVTGSGSTSTN